MSSISGQIALATSLGQTLSGVPGATAINLPVPQSARFEVASGTAADKVDLKYTKTLTFAASTPQVLDLKGLTDIFGGAVAFARIKSIVLVMKGLADGVTLTLGYGTTTANAWTSLISNPGTLTLQAAPTAKNQAFFCLACPNATGWVVGSSNKLLQLDPGSAAFSVDVEITGCSA